MALDGNLNGPLLQFRCARLAGALYGCTAQYETCSPESADMNWLIVTKVENSYCVSSRDPRHNHAEWFEDFEKPPWGGTEVHEKVAMRWLLGVAF